MCGIAGIIRPDLHFPLKDEHLFKVFKGIESRGKDATGITWLDGSNFKVLKTNCPASDFIDLPVFKDSLKDILKAPVILMHTRWASSGSPLFNENNHPIFNNKGVIIHNGHVFFKDKVEGAKGTTDTEQLLLHIQRDGVKKGIIQADGSLSIAYFDFLSKDLYMYSETTPMNYYRKTESLFFASLPAHLKDAFDFPVLDMNQLKRDYIFQVNRRNAKLFPVGKVVRQPTITQTTSITTVCDDTSQSSATVNDALAEEFRQRFGDGCEGW